jgi:hypothetical protein
VSTSTIEVDLVVVKIYYLFILFFMESFPFAGLICYGNLGSEIYAGSAATAPRHP